MEVRTGRGDSDALNLVRGLIAALEGQGIEVRLARLDDGLTESAVTATEVDSLALAEDIASFLPVLTAEDVELAASDAAETDVVVSIGGAGVDRDEATVPLAQSRTSP